MVVGCSQPLGPSDSVVRVQVDQALATPTLTTSDSLAVQAGPAQEATAIPIAATHEALVREALASEPPILLLDSTGLTEAKQVAQQLALTDPQFVRFAYQGAAAEPLLNEVMDIRPALPSDLDAVRAAACVPDACYRVELYNYAYNLTTVALVDVADGVVLDVSPFPETQPDISPRLTDLAVEIAIHAPEVIEALGYAPGTSEATMPNIKTALNDTRCERSRHLCVAPTFLAGDRALWAIVDLTEQRLVGVRWTELGTNSVEPLVTEESLQNEIVAARYCEQSNELSRDGWMLDYVLTSSDGLRISDVQFEGQEVMRSAKLVDWHVSYSRSEGFGYSDAVGCPIFSSAAVIAYNGPRVEEIMEGGETVGFALVQDFLGDGWPAPCHYRYEQRYEFYHDGRFRVGGANLGRGCGTDGVYRPVLRIDITASGDGDADSIAEWTSDGWSAWETEQWALQDEETLYTDEGYQYRVLGADGEGYFIEPSRGQFDDGGRGDSAYLYATRRHTDRDEGEADLITIGSCCNSDYQQGPEQFAQPAEPIEESDLVLWYVAQLPNDDTPGQEYCWADAVIEDGVTVNRSYPCYFGPMFVPIDEDKS